MPYMLSEDKMCVHIKNEDGSMGEKVKCHSDKEKAKAHLTALNMNVSEAMKYASEYVPGYKAITDAPDLRGSSQRHCGNCNLYKYMPSSTENLMYMEGSMMGSEKGICEKHAFLTEYNWVCDDWKEFVFKEAAKVWFGSIAVKIAGDWELDVLGNPYGPDSDSQWFDSNSKIVSGPEIPVIYYHSLSENSKPGRISFSETPIVIGKAVNPTKKSDGTWWRVILDRLIPEAKKVWEAAQKGMAVASSGAIEYLSRLEINGKLQPYDKSKSGRIAIWHMGELSLWDKPGHLDQAHPHAIAIPALKAIYEAAKMTLPPSLVSPKNAESSTIEERKGELEKLHKFTQDIEKFIEINKE